MQVHVSRKKRNSSVQQDVRRRSDTPRAPVRDGRKARQQARHERGETKPRLPRDFFDGKAPNASEMRLWEQKWHDRGSGTELEIARAQVLSRLAQAAWRAISRAERRLLECTADADSKELREELRKPQNLRVQRMRTDLERAVVAGSYDDLIRIKQDCEASLLIHLWQLFRVLINQKVQIKKVQLLLDIHTKARELVEAKHKALACPIGMELMQDPVVAADGYTYERPNIEQHFKTHRRLVHGDFDEVPPPHWEFEAIHDISPLTLRPVHFVVPRFWSPDTTKPEIRSPMTNLPLENLKLFPNLLVRSLIHQEVDAAKCLLKRTSTKATGAEETQEFTHCKDEQGKLLAPMAKEHMLRKEVGFGLRRRVGDLLVKLQNVEEASKDGMAKLQEKLSKLKVQLEQAKKLKMSHKKALADKDTELSKLKAQLAEKDAFNAMQYKVIANLEKAAKDSEKRLSEQANECRRTALQKLHFSYLGEVPTAGTPLWPPARFFDLVMEAERFAISPRRLSRATPSTW